MRIFKIKLNELFVGIIITNEINKILLSLSKAQLYQ